jgi:hypothetical protein
MTVDGVPVPLPDGRIDVGVDEGRQFAPTSSVLHPAVAISKGRVMTLDGAAPKPVPGPFGNPGFALRTLAVDRSADRLAAVGTNGRTVYAGPLSASAGQDSVKKVLDQGNDVLRPDFDMSGNLWLLDRTPSGARVHVVNGRHDRVVRVPGVTGEQVAGFAVSPDGTRLVSALTGGGTPRLLVSNILRGPEGEVRKVARTRSLSVVAGDVGPAVDVGWASPTTVAVLTRPSRSTSQLLFQLADGSPGDGSPTAPTRISTAADSLVTGGDVREPVLVVTGDARLLRLDDSGQWSRRVTAPVTAAAFPG